MSFLKRHRQILNILFASVICFASSAAVAQDAVPPAGGCILLPAGSRAEHDPAAGGAGGNDPAAGGAGGYDPAAGGAGGGMILLQAEPAEMILLQAEPAE